MAEENQNRDALGIARLQVQLESVLKQLGEVSNNMVTKDLYTAQNANVEFRFHTMEDQINKLTTDSAKAQVTLEANSVARHEKTAVDLNAFKTEVKNQFEKNEQRAFEIEQAQESQKNGKWVGIGLALLSGLVSIGVAVIITIVNNGIATN
jgi:tetrahydromethanopterin S-methyltransferase subunit G